MGGDRTPTPSARAAERLLPDVLVALALTLVLAPMAWAIAPTLVRWALARIGVDEIVMTSPTELDAAHAWVVAALAFPPIGSSLVGIAHRLGARRAPSAVTLALVTVALYASTSVGVLANVEGTRYACAAATTTGIAPMISVSSLGLGEGALRLAIEATLVTSLAAFVWGRRARHAIR